MVSTTVWRVCAAVDKESAAFANFSSIADDIPSSFSLTLSFLSEIFSFRRFIFSLSKLPVVSTTDCSPSEVCVSASPALVNFSSSADVMLSSFSLTRSFPAIILSFRTLMLSLIAAPVFSITEFIPFEVSLRDSRTFERRSSNTEERFSRFSVTRTLFWLITSTASDILPPIFCPISEVVPLSVSFTPSKRASIVDEILSSFSFTAAKFDVTDSFTASNLFAAESPLILRVFVISSSFSRIVSSTALNDSSEVSRRTSDFELNTSSASTSPFN